MLPVDVNQVEAGPASAQVQAAPAQAGPAQAGPAQAGPAQAGPPHVEDPMQVDTHDSAIAKIKLNKAQCYFVHATATVLATLAQKMCKMRRTCTCAQFFWKHIVQYLYLLNSIEMIVLPSMKVLLCSGMNILVFHK